MGRGYSGCLCQYGILAQVYPSQNLVRPEPGGVAGGGAVSLGFGVVFDGMGQQVLAAGAAMAGSHISTPVRSE